MKTICLNPKIDGKQPKVENRIYSAKGISTAITTCFMPSIKEDDMDYEGTYQYAKSENFMQGKPRFKRNKKISDCIQTSQKEGVVMKEKKLRIRKLTEGECIRLMGFEKKDTKAMRETGISKSIIYHSAGDSIVTTCLVGIFGQLLGKPHKEITEAYSDRLSEEE